MRLEGKKVILKPEEVEECPIRPVWAASMIQLYGVDSDYKGRLARFSRCPEVLKLAGYEVEIEKVES
jgi:hypothetical protein